MRAPATKHVKKSTPRSPGCGRMPEAEALAVLTDEQKTQLATLRGPKFELDMSQAGGGRGGRGRRGGNNNN